MKKYSIVFDNQCAVCSLGARGFKAVGLMEDDQTIELENFQESQVACNVDPLKACNEMAVVDMDDFSVEYGLNGWARVVSNKSPLLEKLLRSRFGRVFINPLYLFFASNRRIIAPLNTSSNSCTPDLNKKYRLYLLLLAAVFSGVVTFFKGELISGIEQLSFLTGGKLLLVTGLGWLLTGLFYRQKDKWDYWGHLAMIASGAIFIQFIALLIHPFVGHPYLLLGAMLIGDPLMIYWHYKRMKLLGNSQKQTLVWWSILHISALLMLWVFGS